MGSHADYDAFIASKRYSHVDAGFTPDSLPGVLRDFQSDIVRWACQRGRSAIFADTGLGKTLMQLAWASQIEKQTDKPVLVATPLCVAQQTVREGAKFDIACKYLRTPGSVSDQIHVTNYEMLKHFDPSDYGPGS